MARFRITYQNPETGEDVVVIKDFEGYSGPIVMSGRVVGGATVTPRGEATDWAYSVADKGAARIEEVK